MEELTAKDLPEGRELMLMMMTFFKIVYKLVDLDFDRFFIMDSNIRTRGHNLKLRLPRCSTSIRQNFFATRVISAWNFLPNDCVNSTNVKHFKNGLDQLDLSLFLSRCHDDFD